MNYPRLFHQAFVLIIVMISCATLPSCTESQSANDGNSNEVAQQTDPLPSWNEGDMKSSIIDYVEGVTREGGPNFIPVSDRVATFDNDGTLWSEQPAYFQLFFALDRIKALAPDHPEWKTQQPFKAVLENDMNALMGTGMKGLMEVVMTTHAGITTDEFEKIVKDWIATAKHPQKNRPYTDLIYQPMQELVHYLNDNDFKVFIVSGGGIDFMRAWVEDVYGISKDRVVGSSVKTQFDFKNGSPVINRLAELEFNDDKEGKPVGIHKFIGRKPVFAAGNSDGDLQMLQWADANEHQSFQLYVHHTDAEREYAYDREGHIGTFDKGFDYANENGWAVVDMANDWEVIYPFEMK